MSTLNMALLLAMILTVARRGCFNKLGVLLPFVVSLYKKALLFEVNIEAPGFGKLAYWSHGHSSPFLPGA